MLRVIARKIKSLKNRIIKWFKYNDAHYFFNWERVLTKHFQSTYHTISHNHFKAGNYYLDSRIKLNKNSIVYSLGVLRDIDFDIAVSQKYNCKIFMYDPAPISIEFMNQFNSDGYLLFFSIGVWIEDTTLKFYYPKLGGSASAIEFQKGSEYFEASCKTINTLMRENAHTHIDVLKMDIEGAALPITEKLIKDGIYPTQIIVEYERPHGDIKKIIDYFYRVTNICNVLSNLNYEIFLLPRDKDKYFSLELLFVKSDAIALS